MFSLLVVLTRQKLFQRFPGGFGIVLELAFDRFTVV